MIRNLIVLPDGTEIFSGVQESSNIRSVTLTQSVNSDTELTLGSACAAMLECRLQTDGLSVTAGEEITLYRVDDSGARVKVGLFTLEQPTRTSAHIYRLTAYDRVSRLDKDLTDWLAGLSGWPYTLKAFAGMVCAECGLTLKTTEFLNGDYAVQPFTASGITGRQLMRWVGEIAAKFIRATPDGEIELGWYADSGKTITPGGESCYYSGSLSYGDYRVTPIQRVQLRLTSDDVGVCYPDSGEALNTYSITGNYLLTATRESVLKPVAQTIYEAVRSFTYTPFAVRLPAALGVEAGDTITVTGANGQSFTTCVMTKTRSGQSDTLESTGSAARGSPTAVNNTSMQAYNAKLLEVKKSIEGLSVQASSIRTEFDGLQIGGRNLIRSSEDLSDGSYAFTDAMAFAVEYDGAGEVAISAPAIRVSYLDDGDIAITADAVNTAYDEEGNVSIGSSGMGVWESCRTESPCGDQALCAKLIVEQIPAGFVIPEIMRAGQEYTFSFWARSEAGGSVTTCGEEFATLTQWEKHSVTFTAETQALELTFHAPDTYYLYHPKLELGNRATDWTPAPEDTDSAIAAITERVTELSVTADGITAAVEAQQTGLDSVREQVTRIVQTAENVSVKVQGVIDNGTSKVRTEEGFTFDDSGLTISKSGSNITNTVNEKGMYVTRDKGTDNETDMLVANADGVKATDLTARNYLIVGDHARFEDYTDGTDAKRTACFWIEKEGS